MHEESSQREMGEMLSSFEWEATTSLRIMRRSGKTLDLNFQKRFLELSNSRLLTTYFKVQMEAFEENHSQGEHGEVDDVPTIIEIIDSSDEECAAGSIQMVKAELQEDTSIVNEHTNEAELVEIPVNVKNEEVDIEPKPEPLIDNIPMTMFNPLEASGEVSGEGASIAESGRTADTLNNPGLDDLRFSSSSMKRKRAAEVRSKAKPKKMKVVKQFKCDECGYSVKCGSALEVHKRKHTDERPYSCKLCSKRFRTASSLRAHKRVHTEERPHSCNTCYKCFKSAGELKRHMIHHDGEKPYQCSRCSKKFIRKDDLRKHMINHKSRRFPFHCRSCFKRFSEESGRNEHDKICLRRRYECYLCKEYVTNSKDDAIAHMKHHTGESRFQCDICMKKFPSNGNLRNHLRNVHIVTFTKKIQI